MRPVGTPLRSRQRTCGTVPDPPATCTSPPPASSSCARRSLRNLASLAAIVASYLADHRPRAEAERRFYAQHASWKALLATVGFARDMRGRRHSHQRRLTRKALAAARSVLPSTGLRSVTSFADLIEAVEAAIGGIRGIGGLMTYDSALRLGAFLELEPELVYLHSGTRRGAKALGLNHRQQALAMSELPVELRSLRPREVEDLLCIYELPLRDLGFAAPQLRTRLHGSAHSRRSRL
jgi:hypothetical protein